MGAPAWFDTGAGRRLPASVSRDSGRSAAALPPAPLGRAGSLAAMPGSFDPADPSAEPLRKWQEEGDLEALNQLLRVEIGVLKHMIRGKKFAGLGASASASDIAQEAVLGFLKAQTPPSFSDSRALR